MWHQQAYTMTEFRGSHVGDVKETMQQESRFRDMQNRDLNRSHWIKIKYGPLIPVLVGVLGIESWTCQRLLTSGILISQYAKSRCNLSRQIKVESGPLIPVLVRVSGIDSRTCQKLLTSGTPKSQCVKSRLNLNRQIKIWSRPSTRLMSTNHVS